MRGAIGLLALAAVGGCGTSGGDWSAKGFEHKTLAWKATYADGEDALLGPDWRLDNWEKDASGGWRQKGGAGYAAVIDEDGDGILDQHERSHRVHLDDLKFTNVRNNGIIWVKGRRLKDTEVGKDLDVLMENYVGALTDGASLPLRELKALVQSRSDVTLSAQPAITALVELKPRKEEPEERGTSRYAKVHLVMAKFDYLGEPKMITKSSGESSTGARVDEVVTGPRPRLTGLIVVGYVNDSERFDAGLADVAKLLERIELPNLPPTGAPKAVARPKQALPAARDPSAPSAPKKPASSDPANPTLEI
jgi:hypothetical protein